jgi:hypothetical protein
MASSILSRDSWGRPHMARRWERAAKSHLKKVFIIGEIVDYSDIVKNTKIVDITIFEA